MEVMEVKDLLRNIVEYFNYKYLKTGISVSEQVDGCTVSEVDIALNDEGKPRVFRIVMIEIR